MSQIFAGIEKPPRTSPAWEALARFIVVASFSGRPDTIDSLKDSLLCIVTHADFLSSLTHHVLSNKTFWRGGQAHGGLAKKYLVSAFTCFFKKHSTTLAAHLYSWATANTAALRTDAVRAVFHSLQHCSATFQAGDYFVTRALEVCLLAGKGRILGFQGGAFDLDLIFDLWPIGNGTRNGLRLIWPTGLPNQHCERQALRVLQRALGKGQKSAARKHQCITVFLAQSTEWDIAMGSDTTYQ